MAAIISIPLGGRRGRGLACFSPAFFAETAVLVRVGCFALISGHLKATEMFHSYFFVLHKFIQ